MIVVRISGRLESIGLAEALASAISSLYQDDRGDETFSGSAAGEALLLAAIEGKPLLAYAYPDTDRTLRVIETICRNARLSYRISQTWVIGGELLSEAASSWQPSDDYVHDSLADASGAAMVATDTIRTWINHMAEVAHFRNSPKAILEALATRLNDTDHAAGRDAPKALTLGTDAQDAIIQIIAKECDIDDAPIPQWVADLRAAQPAG